MAESAAASLTPDEEARLTVWEEHLKGEFTDKSVPEALATMVEDAHVNHVPVRHRLHQPGGSAAISTAAGLSRSCRPICKSNWSRARSARRRSVDEMILRFTHTVPMAWMLPGIAPTGKRVEIAMVAVVENPDDKVAHGADLLGPGERPRPTWSARCDNPSCRGRRDGAQSGRSGVLPLQRAHHAGSWQRLIPGATPGYPHAARCPRRRHDDLVDAIAVARGED